MSEKLATPNARRKQRLKNAIAEAERFITKAEDVIASLDGDWSYSNKAMSAAKRSSMDLTRSLVPIRQSL